MMRLPTLALLLGMTGAASLRGQDPREPQVARAFREFEPTGRQQLLVTALNPALGPLRGAWPVGVQLLAQTLIEDGKDSIAAVWLRWAIRLSPDLQPDTVLFLPEVIAAYRSARAFVTRTRGPADSTALTTWVWPASPASEPAGRLQIVDSGAVPVRVEVRNMGGTVAAGAPFNPGSYEIGAVAAGFEMVQLTREVLPGVTTVVEFNFRSPGAQVVTEGARPRKKKGFPVAWAGLGAAGVVALVAVLATGGTEPPPQTGGIIITFPSP